MSERTGALELLSDILEVLSVETGGAVCVCVRACVSVCWGGGAQACMRGTLLRAGINSVCSQVSFFQSGHDRVGVFHIS